MIIAVCVLILILSTPPSCHGSINSHSSGNFGYRTQSKGVLDPSICSIKETCEPILKNTTCFGTTLPYSFTSVALVDDSSNQFEVQVCFIFNLFFYTYSESLIIWHSINKKKSIEQQILVKKKDGFFCKKKN